MMKFILCVVLLYAVCNVVSCISESQLTFTPTSCAETKAFEATCPPVTPTGMDDPRKPEVYRNLKCNVTYQGAPMCLDEVQVQYCYVKNISEDPSKVTPAFVRNLTYTIYHPYEYHIFDQVNCTTRKFIQRIETANVPPVTTPVPPTTVPAKIEQVVSFKGPSALNVKDLRGAEKEKIVLPDITQSVMANKATVISWKVNAIDDKPLTLGFWRNTCGNNYKLVGHTNINPKKTGEETFVLTPKQQFEVLKGDVIGMYRSACNAIHYSKLRNCEGKQTFMMINHNIENNVGDENKFRPLEVCGDPLVSATLSVKNEL